MMYEILIFYATSTCIENCVSFLFWNKFNYWQLSHLKTIMNENVFHQELLEMQQK